MRRLVHAHVHRALLTAALAALALPASAGAATKLQPGASMEICTLNFVYDGQGTRAGKVYIGTAAHCVESVGDPVNDGDGNPFGRVAFIGDADAANTDYAFIEVAASEVGRVDPSVKGYPDYPTGFTTTDDTAPGDLIQISGYGLGFGFTPTTQEKRQGVLQGDDAETFWLSGPSVNGDSGGPFVHIATGRALGIVSRYGFETASTDYGPTMQGLLDKAAKAGFPVTLRLAGQTGPAPVPAAQEPQPSGASAEPEPEPGSTPPASNPSSEPPSQAGQESKPEKKPAAKRKKAKARSKAQRCKTKKAKRTKRCKSRRR
jgi:hypothetical protein